MITKPRANEPAFDFGGFSGGGASRVLVAGLPRSGTTWVGEVLGRTAGARYLHEPDNHLVRPDAWWAKRRFGPYPELSPGAAGGDYERLWALAFAGGPCPSALYAGARILQHAGATVMSGRLASSFYGPAAWPVALTRAATGRAGSAPGRRPVRWWSSRSTAPARWSGWPTGSTRRSWSWSATRSA